AFDEGTRDFQPTNLEITSMDVGNPAANVIPAKATLAFNVRFGDKWTADTLKAEIGRRLATASRSRTYRPGRDETVRYELAWRDRPSHVFLTRDERLIEVVGRS